MSTHLVDSWINTANIRVSIIHKQEFTLDTTEGLKVTKDVKRTAQEVFLPLRGYIQWTHTTLEIFSYLNNTCSHCQSQLDSRRLKLRSLHTFGADLDLSNTTSVDNGFFIHSVN